MTVPERIRQSAMPSTISEFTSRDIPTDFGNLSSVSQFTMDNAPRKSADVESIVTASSIAVPKAPRRPRPAYKGVAAGTDSIQNSSIATVATGAINAIGQRYPSFPAPDFTQSIAENAKVRRHNGATGEGSAQMYIPSGSPSEAISFPN